MACSDLGLSKIKLKEQLLMKKTVKVLSISLCMFMLLSSMLVGCTANNTKAVSKSSGVSGKKLTIGYVCSSMENEWYINVVLGFTTEASKAGINFVMADANNDATTQVNDCENYIAQKVDVLIITPVDVNALAPVIQKAKDAHIPIVTESNVVPGANTEVGITDEQAGKNAGAWFADYAKTKNIIPNILIVGFPALSNCNNRVKGFKEALDTAGTKYTIAQEVDGQGVKDKALSVSTDALTAHKDVNVIFGINDDSTTGAMAAYKALGRDESKLTAIGFGFEGVAGRTALLAGGPYKEALAMFPQYVGVTAIDAAVDIANGKSVAAHVETPYTVINADNFSKFYTKSGNNYNLNFDAVKALLNK
jgi:ribose transport system substrate-binding protein